MPKLNTLIADRLWQRLHPLRYGEDVTVRELLLLRLDKQQAAMDAAWTEQLKNEVSFGCVTKLH